MGLEAFEARERVEVVDILCMCVCRDMYLREGRGGLKDFVCE